MRFFGNELSLFYLFIRHQIFVYIFKEELYLRYVFSPINTSLRHKLLLILWTISSLFLLTIFVEQLVFFTPFVFQQN